MLFFSLLSLFLVTFIIIDAGILPTTHNEHKSARVLDIPLSQQEHFSDIDKDTKPEHHNVEFDHEAFLGADEAKQFDKLPLEESKKRLSALVDRIDSDHDGQVSKQELKDWIKHVQTKYIANDVERQWQQIKNDSNDKVSWLSWSEYDNHTFYALYDSIPDDPRTTEQYLRLQKKDRRRFLKADEDGDGMLNKQEFSDFAHPENSPRMKELVITETIEDIDKNADGSISLEEYIGDMWEDQKGVVEPDWVQNERDNFVKFRDLDHDGKMNRKEVEQWLLPVEYDNVEAESVHLLREADANGDNHLTKEEILTKHDVFVGSQLTDWGAQLSHNDL